MKFKHFFVLVLTVLVAVPALMGQQATIEMVVLNSARHSASPQAKLEALDIISGMVDGGSISDDAYAILEYFAFEGTINQVRESGRLVNEFPEVRARAARLLGNVGTPAAKAALIRVCAVDPEPQVLRWAIISLGKIGLNDNNDASDAIVRVVGRNSLTIAPDNFMARAAVYALGNIADNNDGMLDTDALSLLLTIREGPYAASVKNQAREVLDNLLGGSTSGNSK